VKTAERWRGVGDKWAVLSYYQRFESLTAFCLTIIVSLIIIVALFRLATGVISGLILGALDPLDAKAFQSVFGEIMTLLIALEFNHTLQYAVSRRQSIIQVKVVVLIAVMALARKFIILDIHEFGAWELLGMAAITASLGLTYWIMSTGKTQAPESDGRDLKEDEL
jgi:uncharacterized membrane protein (DUF373 family)